MYLVYVDNDFCVIGREYFIQGENKVLTTHNPNLATQFKTQKEGGIMLKFLCMKLLKL